MESKKGNAIQNELENKRAQKEASANKPSEAEQRAREAMLDNEIKMQTQFFSLRERFFVLYTDKFPLGEQSENFQLAHSAARMDFMSRYNDSEKMLTHLGIQIQAPALQKLFASELAG